MFQQGPASALFRAEAFRALGGFPPIAHAGDYLFWLQACAIVNVLLVPADLFYYRMHPGQEIAKPANVHAFARAAAETWRMLNSPACPLTGEALEIGKRNFVYTQGRGLYRSLKRGRLAEAATTTRLLGLGARDWLTYLRPPRRSAAAGTPPPTVSIPHRHAGVSSHESCDQR